MLEKHKLATVIVCTPSTKRILPRKPFHLKKLSLFQNWFPTSFPYSLALTVADTCDVSDRRDVRTDILQLFHLNYRLAKSRSSDSLTHGHIHSKSAAMEDGITGASHSPSAWRPSNLLTTRKLANIQRTHLRLPTSTNTTIASPLHGACHSQ